MCVVRVTISVLGLSLLPVGRSDRDNVVHALSVCSETTENNNVFGNNDGCSEVEEVVGKNSNSSDVSRNSVSHLQSDNVSTVVSSCFCVKHLYKFCHHSTSVED